MVSLLLPGFRFRQQVTALALLAWGCCWLPSSLAQHSEIPPTKPRIISLRVRGASTADETLPAPRTIAAAGMTLDQVINTCLVADPKIRAGLEVINQANA